MIGLGIVGVPCAIEVDPKYNVVYQLSLVKNAFAYRVYRFDNPVPNSVRYTGAATSFAFIGIFPNPAQLATTISFSVTESGPVEIALYDIAGRTVRNINEKLSAAG